MGEGRTVVAALTLMLVLAGASGCLGETATQSARPLLEAAQNAAAAWQSDAVLVAVAGIENDNGTEAVADSSRRDAVAKARLGHDDPAPGDGLAPAWSFEFQSAQANRSFVVVVGADGQVLASAPYPPERSPANPLPLEAWAIDSAQAWQQAPASLRNGTLNYAGSWLMAPPGGRPVWQIWTSAGKAYVDAKDGTVLEESFVRDLGRVMVNGREWGIARNVLSFQDREHDYEVPLAFPRHAKLVLALGFQGNPPPAQSLALVLADESGSPVLYLNHSQAVPLGQEFSVAVLELPGAGNYTARLKLKDPAVLAPYDLSWCTDGEKGDMQGYRPEACERLAD